LRRSLCGGPAQPVVNREARAICRGKFRMQPGPVAMVQLAKQGEEPAARRGNVAASAEPKTFSCGACPVRLAETNPGFVGASPGHHGGGNATVGAQGPERAVVAGHQTRCQRRNCGIPAPRAAANGNTQHPGELASAVITPGRRSTGRRGSRTSKMVIRARGGRGRRPECARWPTRDHPGHARRWWD